MYSVRIWDEKNRAAYHIHFGTIASVAWNSDGRVFATAGDDGRVVVWSPNGRVRYEMLRPSKFDSVAFSPVDTKGDNFQLACANDNGTIYLIRLGGTPPAPADAPPGKTDGPTALPG